MRASPRRRETRALLRAHLAAASGYRHLTRHCPICHRLLRLAMEPAPQLARETPSQLAGETPSRLTDEPPLPSADEHPLPPASEPSTRPVSGRQNHREATEDESPASA